MSPESYTHHAWDTLLDDFEAEIDHIMTEADLPAPPWSPPAGLGPLPLDLEERARQILRAQHAAVRHAQDRLKSARKHRDALNSVPTAQKEAIYLDTAV